MCRLIVQVVFHLMVLSLFRRRKVPDASNTVGCNVCKFMENKPRPENVERYKILILKKCLKALFTLCGKLVGKKRSRRI